MSKYIRIIIAKVNNSIEKKKKKNPFLKIAKIVKSIKNINAKIH